MRTKEIIRNPNFSFLILFLFLFFYYLLVFEPSLYYHHYQPIFLFDKTYLKEFLLYPGGPAEWITQFFLQFFYFNSLGAFFISALSLSIFIIIYKFIKRIGDFKYSLILSFLPVSLLLIIQNHLTFPLIITFKYLFALIFFLVYVKIPERYKIFFIPLSCLIYYILGGWTYLFYIVLCILHELLLSRDSRKYIHAGFNVVVYLIYPYIAARYFFVTTLKEAYLYIVPFRFYSWPFNFNLNLYSYLFFLSLPVLLIALFVYLKYAKVKVKKQNKIKVRLHHISAQSIFIILAAVLILIFSFDYQGKREIRIDYLAEQGRWDELLNVSRGIQEYNILVNFNVNRAFYHTGQLLDNLFDYPQMKGADGLFLENVPRDAETAASDLYFDLGHITEALVLAYEGQTKFECNPRMLKRIVVANIVNEKYVVAKKFLDFLNKSILHKKWVKHYRNYLFNESLIKSDSLIQSKRKLAPKFDFFISISKNATMDLIELLKENENNKMAFEYLMAYYLLEYRIEDLPEHLDKFKKLGYSKYPRHIEEALLITRFVNSSKDVKLDYSINQQTIEQFERFNSFLSSFENKEKARETLTKKFSNTYWYYVLYVKPDRAKLE